MGDKYKMYQEINVCFKIYIPRLIWTYYFYHLIILIDIENSYGLKIATKTRIEFLSKIPYFEHETLEIIFF